MGRGNDDNLSPMDLASRKRGIVSKLVKQDISYMIDFIEPSKMSYADFPQVPAFPALWQKGLRKKQSGIIDTVRRRAGEARDKLRAKAKEEIEEVREDPRRIVPILLPTLTQQALTLVPPLLTGLRPGTIAAVATAKFALRVYSALKTGRLLHKGIKALYNMRQSLQKKKEVFQDIYNKISAYESCIFQGKNHRLYEANLSGKAEIFEKDLK
jgi:hypothetical protein